MADSEFKSDLVSPTPVTPPNAPVPAGVWDTPSQSEQQAYQEFSEAWHSEEDVDLRMLADCETKGTNIPENNYNKTRVVSIDGLGVTGIDGCYTLAGIDQSNARIGGTHSAWFIFSGVSIPKNATINYAFVRVRPYADAAGVIDVTVRGFRGISPPAVVYLNDVLDAPRTYNRVEWSLGGVWSRGVPIDSPNIACVIQELVDLTYWDTVAANERRVEILLDLVSSTTTLQIYDSSQTVTNQAELWIFFDDPAGVKISGTSNVGKLHHVVMSGGVITAGKALLVDSHVMSGGERMAGEFREKLVFRPPISGGARPSGSVDFGPRIYNISPDGGLKIGGDAPNEHSYPMRGGIQLAGTSMVDASFVMQGGVRATGEVFVNGTATLDMQGNVQLAGAADVKALSFYTFEATGAVYIGDPLNPVDYGITGVRFSADGGVTIDNTLNPTIVNIRFNPVLHFLWRVNAYVVKDLTFVWSTGQSAMYWYRIIGKARQGNECDLVADPCCQKFILNVHARTPAELCEKLSKRKFSLPIESVQRFSRPAALGNAFNDWQQQQQLLDRYLDEHGDCEELVPVEFCKIPQCADFCVTFDLVERFEFDFAYVMVDSFFVYEAGNEIDENALLEIGGSAGVRYWRNIPAFSHEATGTITVEEDGAHCWPSMYVTSGGMGMGGEAWTATQRWRYVGGEWPTSISLRPGTTVSSVPVLSDEEGNLFSGDRPWLTPEYALSVDDPHHAWFTYSVVDHQGYSEFLVVKGFNLDIPDDVRVVGIQVQMRKLAQQLNIYETHLVLVLGDEIISDNLASNYQWPYTTVHDAWAWTYGSNGADGETPFRDIETNPWDLDVLRSPDFGVAVRVHDITNQTGCYVGVDWIQIEIAYETVAGQTIRVSGDTLVKSTSYHYEGSGGIQLTSASELRVGRRYITYGYGSGTTAIVMRGTYGITIPYTSIGSITVQNTSADARHGFTDYAMSGGISFGGEAITKPFLEGGRGGLVFGGSATHHYRYVVSTDPSFAIVGEAYTPELRLSQVGEGGVVVEASAYAACSSWSWTASGEVSTGGSAGQRPGSYELSPIPFECDISVLETSAIFTEDTDTQDLEQVTDSLARCGCAKIPLTVAIRHNFIKNNVFHQFLIRNNYQATSAFWMRHNAVNASWQANYHYRGLSANANTYERWDLNFELQCVSNMGGIQLGRDIWKLAISVIRKNLTTQEDFDTRIILGLLPESICLTSDNELDFTAWIDTQTGGVIVEPNATVYQVTIYDNIGLFKNMYWINNPDLTLTVSQKGLDAIQSRIDLTDAVYV